MGKWVVKIVIDYSPMYFHFNKASDATDFMELFDKYLDKSEVNRYEAICYKIREEAE